MNRVYFGTTGGGIYMSSFNTKTGHLGEAVRASDALRPGFIVLHPNGQYLYATDASGHFDGDKDQSVSAHHIEQNGHLTDLNTVSSGGQGPCHISLHPSGQWLLAANYRSGSCAVLPILENGELGQPIAVKQHEGSGPHPTRQEAAHTHAFNSSPDGQFAIATDLGLDQILIYRLEDGSLCLNNTTQTAPGAGPRHLAFHPNGRFAFVSMELNGTVAAYEYPNGTLSEIQTLSTLPAEFDQENTVSEVCITPNGRFLYVGNRGHESLAIFSIDPDTGKLTARGHEPTRGKHPRHFNIDPTGTFLIAANMHTNNIVVFRIDPETGLLDPADSEIMVPAPSCVQFDSAST